jgi:hypothetical protein
MIGPLRPFFAAVALALVACQPSTGPTVDCGPLSDARCEVALEGAKRELDEEWPLIERVVFVENGWDAFTWDGEWRGHRTGDP